MKKSLSSLFIAVILSVTVASVHAAEGASEAVVLALKGNVQVTLPGKTAPSEIKVGDRLPQGTTIVTDVGSELELQAFSGSSTVIGEGSKVELSKLSLTTSGGAVTKQTAEISVSIGSVVSSLDPAKKAINNYSIRTPKGVAAARGTVFKVKVGKNGSAATFVSKGAVEFINSKTGQKVSIPAGFAVTIDSEGTISAPFQASDAQLSEADAKVVQEGDIIKGKDDDKEKFDITIVSPSS